MYPLNWIMVFLGIRKIIKVTVRLKIVSVRYKKDNGEVTGWARLGLWFCDKYQRARYYDVR